MGPVATVLERLIAVVGTVMVATAENLVLVDLIDKGFLLVLEAAEEAA